MQEESPLLLELFRDLNKKIGNSNVSLNSFLGEKDVDRLAGYLSNQDLQSELTSLIKNYSMIAMASGIERQYKIGMERKELLDESYNAMETLFNGGILPEDIYREKIASYLTNSDLENLKKSATQERK